VNVLGAAAPLNKQQIKASITDAIARDIAGADRDEIAQRVDAQYERLVVGAAVLTMIPSLTVGIVRREIIASIASRGSSDLVG